MTASFMRKHLSDTAVVAVMALLLSVLGPFLDHHYAERQFDHSHVSPLQLVAHSHDLSGHAHDHDFTKPFNDMSETPVFNYAGDSGYSGIVVANAGSQGAVALSGAPNTSRHPTSGGFFTARNLVFAPPTPPPRA